MAVRIRKNGRVFCAAISEENEGDCYIDDDTHYQLSVEKKLLITTENGHHIETGGEWFWKGQQPINVKIDDFYLT